MLANSSLRRYELFAVLECCGSQYKKVANKKYINVSEERGEDSLEQALGKLYCNTQSSYRNCGRRSWRGIYIYKKMVTSMKYIKKHMRKFVVKRMFGKL